MAALKTHQTMMTSRSLGGRATGGMPDPYLRPFMECWLLIDNEKDQAPPTHPAAADPLSVCLHHVIPGFCLGLNHSEMLLNLYGKRNWTHTQVSRL